MLADASPQPVKTPLEGLRFVAVGSKRDRPWETLAPEVVRTFLDRIGSEGDVTLMDSSPLLKVADASRLAAAADGVILVVRAGRLHRRDARWVRQFLEAAGAPPLWVVLNGVPFGADAASLYRQGPEPPLVAPS